MNNKSFDLSNRDSEDGGWRSLTSFDLRSTTSLNIQGCVSTNTFLLHQGFL
ncbi:hypothetical protein [Nostoc sp. PCC 7524]|uniref:hypothetical protein n=1 Tax=Nostoc sp. (strain ATCC 29411 / PCC 7524) TaxID=28072 RepID=UPI000AB32011|nr:hypothetical protein [Nostoc sp. PCC 7524]